MKPISTSIYTFEKMIAGDCLYVDKTAKIYEMVKQPFGEYFCARPRRFGKSLTVSTLEAIFRGRRELFEGLAIAREDYDWPVFPVVHLDFSAADAHDGQSLTSWLTEEVDGIADSYGVPLKGETAARRFRSLIKGLARPGAGVVILVDEYDKPISDNLGSPFLQDMRRELEDFYQIIKSCEAYERFVFITGVTRFAKVSVFSKLNSLDDISMIKDFSTLFGYTQAELEANFAEYIDGVSARGVKGWDGERLDRMGLLSEVARWYDGFCFAEGSERVYNPVSIGKFFANDGELGNYWFDTGTPSILIDLIERNGMTLVDVVGATMSLGSLGTFDLSELSGDAVSDQRIVQLLYQTGYLTIDRIEQRGTDWFYRLRYPNQEVRLSFENSLFGAYAGKLQTFSYGDLIAKAARNGDTAGMIEALKGLIAGIPYPMHVKAEEYWQSMVYTALRACGLDIRDEVTTNIGRIDAVLRAGAHLYLIEFKMDGSCDQAVAQIDEKRYDERYLTEARARHWHVHKLGINFSWADGVHNIYNWREES